MPQFSCAQDFAKSNRFGRTTPQWQTEIGRRLDGCLDGNGHPADDLLALHDRLSEAER